MPPLVIPKLGHHRASGRAICRLNGRDHYLGIFGTPKAKANYDRLIAEWLANGRRPFNEPEVKAATRSVNEVLLAFFEHAQCHYRLPDGTQTSEVREFRHSLRPVRELYGLTPAAEFGPRALAAVRQKMIDAGRCRTLVNKRIDRVKRAFKWAVAEELVPVSVYEALRTLSGLRRGRTDVRESKKIKPVEAAVVDATTPHLDDHLRAMVEVQRLTGMRPGEVCHLRLSEVDRSEEVWLYRPRKHKTAHQGRERVVPIGPKARAALVVFLLRGGTPPQGFGPLEGIDDATRLVVADAYQEVGRESDAALLRDLGRALVTVAGCVVDPEAPIFSPAEAREERFRTARANRKSKVPPSQRNRRKAKPVRVPGRAFTTNAYGHAIQRAAERAGVPHWHPNQLRHLFGTSVRKAHGLEAAQVLLGHARADVTQVYAERDLALAVRIAAEIG